MSGIIKRVFLMFSMALISFCAISCEKEKTQAEIFFENYSEKYPNGYDLGYQWYNFTKETVVEVLNENKKQLLSESFVGYVDFEANSLKGITKKFKYTRELTEIKEGEVCNYSYSTSYLNDNQYFEIVKKGVGSNLQVTKKGSSNIEDYKIEIQIDSLIFYAERYYNPTEDLVSVTDDYVNFDNAYSNESKKYSLKYGFYYDEDYDITEIYSYYSSMYNKNNPNLNLVSSRNMNVIRYLTFAKEIEIDVPTDYDEEYVYDKEVTYLVF